ncbi:hypothetical protein WA026_001538 [Henosepilachna vigintioctopunctata]|uniref:Uncharacterized protein n=1 Tax=Henosepilachna vigintioctopunctata TaxID=420089 RepID=A0AAW1UQN5_9CUCU
MTQSDNFLRNSDSLNTSNIRKYLPKNNRKVTSRFSLSLIRVYIKEYCEVSTIQGLRYIVISKSSVERLWWISVFMGCVMGCSYMTYLVINRWITTPVLVTLATKETPILEIPFPAVTICPETKISHNCLNYTKVMIAMKKKNLTNISNRESQNYDYMAPLCELKNHAEKIKEQERKHLLDRHFSYTSRSLGDYAEFLSRCKALDLNLNAYCQWMGNDVECAKILTPLLTDEGLCYSFNMFDVRDIYSDINQMKYFREGWRNPDWHPDEGYKKGKIEKTYPRRTFLNGAKNSLIVAFFTNKSEIYYSCRDFSLQGIRVSLHAPTKIPRPSQVFFSVGLNRLTTVSVTPTLMRTTPAIQMYDPTKRNCYFSRERKLKYYKLYNQDNCNMECWTNYTIQHCGCTHFYMPRDQHTKICNMSRNDCLNEASISYPHAIFEEHVKKNIGTSYCNCFPLCTELKYDAEIATGEWHFYNSDEVALDGMRDWFSNFELLVVYFNIGNYICCLLNSKEENN